MAKRLLFLVIIVPWMALVIFPVAVAVCLACFAAWVCTGKGHVDDWLDPAMTALTAPVALIERDHG